MGGGQNFLPPPPSGADAGVGHDALYKSTLNFTLQQCGTNPTFGRLTTTTNLMNDELFDVAGPYFKVKQRGVRSSHRSPVYKADSRRRLLMELPRPLLVAGDVKIEFYDRQGPGKVG